MIVRNRIWEELKQAYVHVLCIQRYNDRHRRWNRQYELFLAIVASIGVFSRLFDESLQAAWYALLGVAAISTIKNVAPHVLQKEEELSTLDKMSDFYIAYMSELEKLFYQLDNQIIEEQTIAEKFFKLKKTECDKQSVINKLIHKVGKKEQRKLDQISEEYINEVYFNKYEINGKNTEN